MIIILKHRWFGGFAFSEWPLALSFIQLKLCFIDEENIIRHRIGFQRGFYRSAYLIIVKQKHAVDDEDKKNYNVV